MKESFADHNKRIAFDFLMDEYLKQGFGTMTKGDIDLLFFTAINKYSNLKDKSDYALSKQLKITQARIRNLKVKEGLRFSPMDAHDVEDTFIEKAHFARIEEDGKRISIPIYDPNIFIELENIIERNNGYVEAQLNPKIFTIRIDQFISLLISFQSKNDSRSLKKYQNEFLLNIKDTIKKEDKYAGKLEASAILNFKDLQKQILDKGVSFGLELLCDAMPFGSFAKRIADTLIKLA